MRPFRHHLILSGCTVKEALVRLNELAQDSILFVVDNSDILIGSLTDGDVRRALLNNFSLENKIDDIIQANPKFIKKGEYNIQDIILFRKDNFKIIPVLDDQCKVINIINFRKIKSYLPIDAVIIAGGRGKRLRPLTDAIPKPLIKVGDKAIMEHNLDRLVMFGVDDIWISVNYLGEQIEEYFGNGIKKNICIEYVKEKEPLGTIGAVSFIKNFKHDYILITNSDLLTNIDYEKFFIDFLNQKADLAVLAIPYKVSIPYAVLETNNGQVSSFKEKPNYTFLSNGGIYLIKRDLLDVIPKNSYYDATDLIQNLLQRQHKVITYPFSGYWLDVGKHEDLEKAKIDFGNIEF